jgi:hypothetical protein
MLQLGSRGSHCKWNTQVDDGEFDDRASEVVGDRDGVLRATVSECAQALRVVDVKPGRMAKTAAEPP